MAYRHGTPAAAYAVPGQIARLELEEHVEQSGVWVPASALARGVRGLWAVYAVSEDAEGTPRVVRHHVEVLHAESERALVRGTVDQATPIIVGNSERVGPGQAVEPLAKDTGGASPERTTGRVD